MVATNTAGRSHCHGPQAVRHLRVPDGLGLLHSGLVRALRYAEEVGALSAEQAAHWRASGWQVMLRLAEKQTKIVADERPVLRFLTTLGERLTQGKLRLEAVRGESGCYGCTGAPSKNTGVSPRKNRSRWTNGKNALK